MSDTYKAIVCHEYGQPLTINEYELPNPVSGTVVVKVLSASIIKRIKELIAVKDPIFNTPLPFVPGNYGIGRIHSVGAGSHLKPGQLVYLDSVVFSRETQAELIIKGSFGGATPASKELAKLKYKRDGYLQQYALVDIDNCYPINEAFVGEHSIHHLNNLAFALVPYAGLRSVGLKAGETVIIAPSTGKFSGAAVAVASAMGATVIAVGRNQQVLKRLENNLPNVHPVTLTGDKDTDAAALAKFGPANVFLDLNPSGVPSNPYFESCLNALAYEGRVVIQGNLSQPLTISPFNFRFKNLTVRSKTMYTRDEAKDLIRLAESGALKYWAMHRIQQFAFEEFEKAFSAAETATSWDDLVVLDLA